MTCSILHAHFQELEDAEQSLSGADEKTPSRAQFFSWINNTNEGATEGQTIANLAFFKYLHDEYGMTLGIYAFDAGAIDGAGFYGSTDSERFRRQFPKGFGPAYRFAKSMGTRLGVWGGPDGFGQSSEQAQRRIEMMSSLCRDYEFALFKFDAVCGQLPTANRPSFVEMMERSRKYSPDLILLNHRLDLGEGLAHATTFLWEGAETYIDVHMANSQAATHSRVCALSRGLPPDLKRLCEDHGVCLSSCLDYWEDDLILQAFNRSLILAPEVYGNPWLLRDDELPKLARIYNLHRRYREILVHGLVLPEAGFGPHAVSRGDANTRLITLRNLTWEPVRYAIPLDETIGLGARGPIELRQFHPVERVVGTYAAGEKVEVEVLPFRACLVMASAMRCEEPAVLGCDYEVIRDVAGRPIEIDLEGPPGTSAEVRLHPDTRARSAVLAGKSAEALAMGGSVRLEFPGKKLTRPWHRKLAELAPSAAPADAEGLYEATCFAADNNALEVREVQRSGPTAIAQVQAARDAFFGQPIFRQRNVWDRNLFDDDPDTAFAICRRWPWTGELRIRGGNFRVDFGKPVLMDRLVLEAGNERDLQPLKWQEAARGAVSADLKTWVPVSGFVTGDIEMEIPPDMPIRYFRLSTSPDLIREVRGSYRGKALDRSGWRASNLFASYRSAPAEVSWSARFVLNEIAPNSYLVIAAHGEHGNELASAAIRTPSGYIGAHGRAPSFRSNTWECPVRTTEGNTSWFFRVDPSLVGQPLEAVLLGLKGCGKQIRAELWTTCYPLPNARFRLTLERGQV